MSCSLSVQALATSSASFADSLYGLRRVPVDAQADSVAGTSGRSDGAAGSANAPARALSRAQQRVTLLLLVRLCLVCSWSCSRLSFRCQATWWRCIK